MAAKFQVLFYRYIPVILLPFLIKTTNKNACNNYFDYFLINFSDRCYYNPDVDLTVPELIEKYTGNLKNYSVTTSDGYILSIFRIYKKNPVGVVLLQPPISTGAEAWMQDGNESIAFKLWNLGYDVWLTNHRGTSYSRKHVNFTDSDSKYWDFGFHEIALHDFEAQFDLIRNETENSKIIYIGYSMSSTTGLVYASLKPEEAHQILETLILLAPPAIMTHFTSPFKYLLDVMAPFEKMLRLSEFWTFEAWRWIGNFLTITPLMSNIGGSIVMGWTPTEMDPSLYPYIFANHGRGIPNKMLYHYAQIVASQNQFPLYDYGNETNNILYGFGAPPNYPLENIKTPTYIIYGDKDILATPQDVEFLCDELLPSNIIRGKFRIPNCNHIDFLFGKHRRKKIHEVIANILGNKII